MDLLQAIKNWDGKSSDKPAKAYEANWERPSFTAETIAYLERPESRAGASWLLKRYLERGNTLDSAATAKVYANLASFSDWATRLHILQCLQWLPISERDRLSVEGFLRTGLEDQNKFVHAWSYHGFYELARQFPAYKEEARLLFETGLKNEAASVKARIRNIMKKSL